MLIKDRGKSGVGDALTHGVSDGNNHRDNNGDCNSSCTDGTESTDRFFHKGELLIDGVHPETGKVMMPANIGRNTTSCNSSVASTNSSFIGDENNIFGGGTICAK